MQSEIEGKARALQTEVTTCDTKVARISGSLSTINPKQICIHVEIQAKDLRISKRIVRPVLMYQAPADIVESVNA
jgi:hypothetical protein